MAACGSTPLTVNEFCDLSARVDAETVLLVQIDRGTAEFDRQLELVRDLNDELFANPPAAIADTAAELRPLLTQSDADNAKVNQLLDDVAQFVTENCAPQR